MSRVEERVKGQAPIIEDGFARLLAEVQKIALLFPEEIKFLFSQARALVGVSGTIVDIGAFKGGSAISMALGVKAGMGTGKVHTIDTFEHQPDFPGEGWGIGGEVHQALLRNIERFEVADYIEVIAKEAAEAARSWPEPVKLLFYDSSVMYQKVMEDISLWAPLIIPGGLMLFHDYSDYPIYGSDLKEAVDEFAASEKDFSFVTRFGQTAVIRRCG